VSSRNSNQAFANQDQEPFQSSSANLHQLRSIGYALEIIQVIRRLNQRIISLYLIQRLYPYTTLVQNSICL